MKPNELSIDVAGRGKDEALVHWAATSIPVERSRFGKVIGVHGDYVQWLVRSRPRGTMMLWGIIHPSPSPTPSPSPPRRLVPWLAPRLSPSPLASFNQFPLPPLALVLLGGRTT